MTQAFPKVRVKNCFLSKGEAAATELAQEIGGITAGKLKRWFGEWSGSLPCDEAGSEPVPDGELTDEQLKRMGIKFTRLSKSEAILAKAWHDSQAELARTRPERLAVAKVAKQNRKANRKLKKEIVVDEWTAIKKEARKRGLDPYDLLAERRKKMTKR
jgi:hypothetical protein